MPARTSCPLASGFCEPSLGPAYRSGFEVPRRATKLAQEFIGYAHGTCKHHVLPPRPHAAPKRHQGFGRTDASATVIMHAKLRVWMLAF